MQAKSAYITILGNPQTNGSREAELLKMQKASIVAKPVMPDFRSLMAPKPRKKITMEEIVSKVDKQTLFLLAFVPFVIAEVAWDYVDTCLDMCQMLRIQEVKKLCRRVKELRKDYDYKRGRSIDQAHRDVETDNMIMFQEDYKEFFNKLHINIKGQVNIGHPGLCTESHMLISAAYSSAVVLRALFKYMSFMENRVAQLLGIKAIGSLVIEELRELEKLVLHFAGEDSINNDNKFPEFLNPFVDTLCNYMKESEMVELPCPID